MVCIIKGVRELPPRARRILTSAFRRGRVEGTTSACAENTYHCPQPTPPEWNYLRVRGEYERAIYCTAWAAELPPRARRIQQGATILRKGGGTTSACAENTRRQTGRYRHYRNYLRVRGEYRCHAADFFASMELPPRARRIPNDAAVCRSSYGTTSACAENTAVPGVVREIVWNYLRVRGEYAPAVGLPLEVWELPPRARRIPSGIPDQAQQIGTTSACAENTSMGRLVENLTRNYLRVRGEYPHTCYTPTGSAELPPRARRIRMRHGLCHAEGGTTSACAENTLNELGLL